MALNILLLRDKNPGHYNQSEGIVDALSLLGEVRVIRIDIPRRIHLFNWLSRHLSRLNVNKTALALCRLPVNGAPKTVDLVISSGGATLASNVALSQRYQCKNIFSGSIRSFRPENFTCILHIDADRKNWPRHVVGVKPTPVASSELEQVNRPPITATLLLGGPITGCALSNADIAKILEAVFCSGLRWTIMDSRRTPIDWSSQAKALSEKNDKVSFLHHADTPHGSLQDVLAKTDAVLVTGDSTSMISDAIALQRPTVSLEPEGGSVTRDKGYLETLEAETWLKRLSPPFGNWHDIEAALESIRPKQEPAVVELAETLRVALDL